MKFKYDGETFEVEVLLSGQVVVELEGVSATINVQMSEEARYSVTGMEGEETAATPKEALQAACRSLATWRAQIRQKKAVEDDARNQLVDYVTGLATGQDTSDQL